VAHAEASARTVDAAVTAAAAQLGLRSDQVDVEVLEEPVASTFGYIGSPARVRVTPRPTSSNVGADPGGGSSGGVAGTAGSGSAPAGARAELDSDDRPSAQVHSTDANVSNEAAHPGRPGSVNASPTASTQAPAPAAEAGNGQVPAERSPQATDQLLAHTQTSPGPERPGSQEAASSLPEEGPGQEAGGSSEGRGSSQSAGESATGLAPSAAVDASAPVAPAAPSGQGTPPSAPAPGTPPSAAAPEAARRGEPGSSARATRPPRRTYKDEPIEPQMVEEDTERAGDFLEGLLDALDVDGDIATWIDEVGGHIELEGADLEVLVGPNGETLDALQDLTRLAVLRRSKRRVRLLIDINGFRARHREQLTAMVRATVEQVIRTREDHELQPMSPAERKIVHDAVAAMEGARTESLGEEPNRRVVIRPA
jgi:spoIIIJ-associated protein